MILAFGTIELDLERYELRDAGDAVTIQPQVFDVLHYLVSSRGRLVSKEELLDAVWGDRFVSESALTSRIKEARRAVGDDGDRQGVIRTVHGRGYRFLPEVNEVARAEEVAEAPPTSALQSEDVGRHRELLERDDVLLEREDVLAQLAASVATAKAGSGRLVLVSGEAGIGKSSAIRRFAHGCPKGTPVLLAACDDLITPRALGAVRDLLQQLPAERRAELPSEPDAATLLAALGSLAGDGACVVVIEDLHWADDGTFDLTLQLSRRIRDAPVVLVLTYRDEEVPLGHPLRRVLAAVRGPHVTSIRLAPLSEGAVTALTRESGRDAVEVFRATGGNPLFVTELLRSPTHTLPESVKDAVWARLGQLTAAEVAPVRAISVVPARLERELIAELDLDPSHGLAAAERLGLICGDATHVWFRHELVRRAVEDTLTSSERVQLHHDVARALHRRGADPARVTHHAARCDDVALLLEAGPAAAMAAVRAGAQRQVVEYLDHVLRHADRLAPAVRAELLTHRAHSLYLLNRFDASRECAEAAVAAAEALGDDRQLARSLIALGRAGLWARGPQFAAAAVRRAIDVLGEEGDLELRSTAHADLSRALGELTTVGSVADANPEALVHAATAVALAEQLGRSDLHGYARMYLGSERLAAGDQSGLDDLEEAVRILSEHPRTDFAVRACVNASGASFRAGRHDDVERYVELGLGLARGAEFFSGEYRLALTRAASRMSRGRWPEARDELTALLGQDGEPGIMEPLARSLLARILARQGHADEARRVLAPAAAAVTTADEAKVLGPVTVARVELAWLAGDRPELAALAPVAARPWVGAIGGELARYLSWAGVEPPLVTAVPEPWASGLAGAWRAAAARWAERGERYEQALELMSSREPEPTRRAVDILEALGAQATLAAALGG